MAVNTNFNPNLPRYWENETATKETETGVMAGIIKAQFSANEIARSYVSRPAPKKPSLTEWLDGRVNEICQLAGV